MLRSGIVCAVTAKGNMPGSASAAESSIEVGSARSGVEADFCAHASDDGKEEAVSDSPSVAATTASADAETPASPFFARIDVRRRLGIERVGIELHLGLGEIAFFPRLRRSEGRARRHCEQRDNAKQPGDRRAHQRGATSARIRCSSAERLSSRKPCSMATTFPPLSIRYELGIALTA